MADHRLQQLHRYLNVVRPRVERCLLAHSLVGFALFLAPDYPSLLFWGYGVWYAFLVAFGLYATVFLMGVYYRQGNTDAYLMLLVGSVIVVCGIHDIMLVNHHWTRFDGFTIQYSAFPTVLLFGWFLLRRFAAALTTSEMLSRSLEKQVEEKEHQLSLQYRKLYDLEKEQLLASERDRLMRDMHDGFGGSLVSLATMLQQQNGPVFERAYSKVQLCLTDLRMVIDSLDPMINDISMLLATLRTRLQSQLESANVALEWEVTALPASPPFSPQRNLHIMRIVQEAINNSVKHTNAKVIKVRSGLVNQEARAETNEGSPEPSSSATVFISIEDITSDAPNANSVEYTKPQGRGIKNMHWRAKQLGGKLEWRKGSTGTTVTLLLPREFSPS
ncbi:hypothetical protein LRP49_01730 [Enterovibrio sp. ZSDZ35]|uniref:Signal transduction histidine kinase n=1 Tax=Enterovibrio qingdaonensis TaxID=2899818 RepID=A0ABT5QG02_9GAMM|nr:hypothetical protein [Enterovibrio sp. ZSDZ35]MDD1779905.1 hypothetical protein [Enterovibrio sp. ZSDZ35]